MTVNLIDTPGHSGFIAEVERALSVLDGAVLMVSAVEGVQVQTRLLMRTLARLRIPTCVFVNKIDRVGARYDELLADISRLLTPAAVPMGSVDDLGLRAARFVPFPPQNKGFWPTRASERLNRRELGGDPRRPLLASEPETHRQVTGERDAPRSDRPHRY